MTGLSAVMTMGDLPAGTLEAVHKSQDSTTGADASTGVQMAEQALAETPVRASLLLSHKDEIHHALCMLLYMLMRA